MQFCFILSVEKIRTDTVVSFSRFHYRILRHYFRTNFKDKLLGDFIFSFLELESNIKHLIRCKHNQTWIQIKCDIHCIFSLQSTLGCYRTVFRQNFDKLPWKEWISQAEQISTKLPGNPSIIDVPKVVSSSPLWAARHPITHSLRHFSPEVQTEHEFGWTSTAPRNKICR